MSWMPYLLSESFQKTLSPFTKSLIIWEKFATAWVFFSWANKIAAFDKIKSPAKMVSFCVKHWFTDGLFLRVIASSITSSCNRLEVCIISAIIAIRFWDNRSELKKIKNHNVSDYATKKMNIKLSFTARKVINKLSNIKFHELFGFVPKPSMSRYGASPKASL